MVGSELPRPETRASTVTDVVELSVDRGSACAGARTIVADPGRRRSTSTGARSSGSPAWRGTARRSCSQASWVSRPADRGTIHLGGGTSRRWSTERAAGRGVGYIPEDRHERGSCWPGPAVGERDARPPGQAHPFSQGRWIDKAGARQRTRRRSSGVPGGDARPRRGRGVRAVGRQPAEAHRGTRDDGRAEACSSLPADPGHRRRCPGAGVGGHPRAARRNGTGPPAGARPTSRS